MACFHQRRGEKGTDAEGRDGENNFESYKTKIQSKNQSKAKQNKPEKKKKTTK